jgi:hypothetical protein
MMKSLQCILQLLHAPLKALWRWICLPPCELYWKAKQFSSLMNLVARSRKVTFIPIAAMA